LIPQQKLQFEAACIPFYHSRYPYGLANVLNLHMVFQKKGKKAIAPSHLKNANAIGEEDSIFVKQTKTAPAII
jgi:hypothetical protein